MSTTELNPISETSSVNASFLWLASTLTTITETLPFSSANNDTLSYSATSANTLWDENRRKANHSVFIVVYLAVLMISGCIGNCLVCYVYYFRFPMTTANLFILVLGVLDLASCCIGMPFEMCDISYPYMFDAPVACKIFRFVESVTIMASAATLMCVAFDRYFKVWKPFKTLPLRIAWILCLASMLLGLLLSWPALVIFGRQTTPTSDPNITGVECTVDDSVRGGFYPTLYYGTLLGVFVISLCVITTLYILLGRKIWKIKRTAIGEVLDNRHRPSTVSVQSTTSSDKEERRDSKSSQSPVIPNPRRTIRAGRTTAIFITVTVIFVLSFLPFLIVTLLKALKVAFNEFKSHQEDAIYNLCARSYFINNSINPLIYSVMNVKFRKECLAVFKNCTGTCKKSKVIKHSQRTDSSAL